MTKTTRGRSRQRLHLHFKIGIWTSTFTKNHLDLDIRIIFLRITIWLFFSHIFPYFCGSSPIKMDVFFREHPIYGTAPMVAPLRVPTSLGRRWPHHSDPPVVVNVSWMSVEYLPVPVNVSDKLRLCELEHGPVEIVDDYPLIAWWFSHQFFVCLPEGSWIYLSNRNLHLHDFGLLAHDHQLCNVSRRYLWLI